jgi:hypothetical protein
MWFYDDLVTVGFWFNKYKLTSVKITKAAFLWWSNFVCFIAHASFAVVSIYMSTKGGSTMLTPILTIYTTNLTWVPNSTDALVPQFQKTGGLYLAWMVVSFFLLSAFFHLTIVLLNFNQSFVIKRKCVDSTRNQCCNRSFTYFIHQPARKVTFWTGWYFTRIVRGCSKTCKLTYVPLTTLGYAFCVQHDCRNQLRYAQSKENGLEPMLHSIIEAALLGRVKEFVFPPVWPALCSVYRWIEYSFSASLMAMVFAISGGLHHIYIVLMIFGLMWCTMTFGWVSEVYNRPISRGDDIKPYYWQINDKNPSTLQFPSLPARLQRLVPYFLGWVP